MTTGGRVVAVTGASAGIGRATARLLAAQGARVLVSARRADRLDALAAEIARDGGTAVAVPGDVADGQDMERLVARAVETFGRLDVMICNAGIGFHGTLEQTPPDVIRRLVDVNLLGTVHAARAALAVMRPQGSGHIIAVSSIVGRRGVAGSSVYAATKAGQIAFVESLRAEFAGTRLHASVIVPVATNTEFRAAIERDYGYVTEGKGPRQSAEDVARAIARCIDAPAPEVYPLWRARVLAILSVVAPGLADRVVGRFGRRQVAPGHAPHDRTGA